MALPFGLLHRQKKRKGRGIIPRPPCLREARRFSGRASYRSLVGNRGNPFSELGLFLNPQSSNSFPFYLFSQGGLAGASILGFDVPQLSSLFSPANADVAVAAIIATVIIAAATKVAATTCSILL
jgi:hypothetical protein